MLTRFDGRGSASGAPLGDFFGGSLFSLNAGKVTRLALFTDTQKALEAAGLQR